MNPQVAITRAALAALVCAAAVSIGRADADADCATACAPPVLGQPEGALRRAVHLTWSDDRRDRARRYEIERRGGSGAWQAVASIPVDAPAHLDDAPPDGSGLDPGEYAYRIRGLHRTASGEAWSAWSDERQVTVREACVESGELAGLPRVVAGDLDGDGRHTGKDIELALRKCSSLGGCVLEALPVTYDDVAILISDGDAPACKRERTACLTERFPKGLAIEGHGRSSVWRSPLWSSPYQPQPVLDVLKRPDLRIQLRHLVLDGRKGEQRDPKPGENDANGWQHYGFQVWNRWTDHDKRNSLGCVHDVLVRDFMTRGIALADVARWNVEYNTIEGIGCASRLTPCPLLTVPDAFGPGYKSTGLGIYVGWHSDAVVIRGNRIRRCSKTAISLKHGNDGGEATILRPLVEDNDIDETGQIGIFAGGIEGGLFRRNRIARTDSLSDQPKARAYNDTFGISCNGAAERTEFVGNRIEQTYGMAIMWNCRGRENVIAETRISGSCRGKGPRSCTPNRQCYTQPDIWVVEGAAGSLALVNDEVVDSLCSAPLAVDMNRPDMEIRIRGGRYAAGRDAMQPVRFSGADVLVEPGTAFTDTGLEFGPGARGIVAPGVSVTGRTAGYRVHGLARALVCAERPQECRALCSRRGAPSWCAGVPGGDPTR